MRGKWKVQCNYVPGVGKLYRAIRLLDTRRIEESGNIEGYGEYSEDRDAVQETVDKLNAAEEMNPSERKDELVASRCPVCGREFFPTSKWGWKIGGVRLCRYNCCLEYEKQLQERNRRVRAYRSHGRVLRYGADGALLKVYENAEEAAKDVGVPRSVIRAYCKKKAPDPTGAQWEFEERRDKNEEASEENS